MLTIFSQYGVPTHVKLARDYSNGGKSKGFAFLKYEDWRSTVLAVDNLNGIRIKDRTIRVDHTTYRPTIYQDEDDERMDREWEAMVRKEMEKDFAEGVKEQKQQPAQQQLISQGQEEQSEQQSLNEDIEDDSDLEDPMKNFLSKG
ncbi:BA75_01487T0 [Komagataella pastoris]|uniref:BA75_01487T0 n=1 Tax=Komagataella pastoris TaxID=4922 RepID=A0A1B2J820_PICPA|nr:BA75_01487T0 [Komagataella pastoris]